MQNQMAFDLNKKKGVRSKFDSIYRNFIAKLTIHKEEDHIKTSQDLPLHRSFSSELNSQLSQQLFLCGHVIYKPILPTDRKHNVL